MFTKPPARDAVVFLLVFGVAMAFALYTRHAWEDFWITFRTSRNLAEGLGLVYTPGERLHTFTSPLGVLLPSLAYLLTFNSSDYAALWIYRLMSAAALGGAGVLLHRTARKEGAAAPVAAAFVLFLATDAKTIDFTINGMETGFLMLFLAWVFYALVVRPERTWLHLGLAWGGLMWTRPDSFIYIAALSAGVWLFNDRSRTGLDRIGWMRLFLTAGLITTAVYLPWLTFTSWYYGTPVPHTITAKGMSNAPVTWSRFAEFVRTLPQETWRANNSVASTFLPSYYIMGGWPGWVLKLAAILGTVIGLVWLLPFVRWTARAASFAFLVGHLYLSFIPYFPFPWYLPTNLLLSLVVLGVLLDQMVGTGPRMKPPGWLGAGLAACFILMATALTLGSAVQLRAGQHIVEDGNRKQIGLHLRDHAAPGDTVFMEPLGYIGYFSGIKTLDFPGLSTREVTDARKQVGNVWSDLINYLQPAWLVLRDEEIRRLNVNDASILAYRYQPARVFDVRDEVRSLNLPGRHYLEFDSRFTVFRREESPLMATPYGPARGAFDSVPTTKLDGVDVIILHAPSDLFIDVPAGARSVTLQFGFVPGAYEDPGEQTDGARFAVYRIENERQIRLWERSLSPVHEMAERGLQTGKIPLDGTEGRLILRIHPGESMTRDWTAWAAPVFN